MSRTRIVKGNVTKIVGGSYKIFSKENIENYSEKRIIQVGKEGGVIYGEPEKFQHPVNDDTNTKYYLIFEVVNKEKVFIYSEAGHPKDYTRNPFKGSKLLYLPEIIYVRFSMTNSLTGVSYYVPGNPNLNKIFPYNEGMFQSINTFDWREHEDQLKIILHEVFNIYYPNSEFKSSVVMHKDSPAKKTTQAYTIANEEDNRFSNDTIDPIIVFLLDDKGHFMHVGQNGNLFDILSTIDHEYIHYKYLQNLKTLLENGVEVKDALDQRTTDENERKTIDEQRKNKYYEKTTDTFKKAMADYYGRIPLTV